MKPENEQISNFRKMNNILKETAVNIFVRPENQQTLKETAVNFL